MKHLCLTTSEEGTLHLLEQLDAEGVEYELFENIPTIVVTDRFIESEHVVLCEEDSEVFLDYGVTIDYDFTGGNWGNVMAIRRTVPYPHNRLQESHETSFEAVRTGAGVDLYLVDSGTRASHDEFRTTHTMIYDGQNAAATGGYTSFHGTAVASQAVGVSVGIAPDTVVYSAVVASSAGGAPVAILINGINACITHYNSRASTNRPAVMNISLSGPSTLIDTAAQSAVSAGIVVVCSAGNDLLSLDTNNLYPANSPGVICVGGINPFMGPYYTSGLGTNYSPTIVKILAAAQRNWSANTTGDDDYQLVNGTSFSSPIVAGIVCALLQGHTRADALDVRQYLYDTATTGLFRPGAGIPADQLPDRIAYLDPTLDYEEFT